MVPSFFQFQCCGVENSNDFSAAQIWDRTRRQLVNNVTTDVTLLTPFACCKLDGSFPDVTPVDTQCAVTPTTENSFFMQVAKLKQFM